MDFESFASDDEDMKFMPERKNKNDKKRKSKGAFRPDKKEKGNFIDSPAGGKTKNVHGVVGPAEYIQEQISPNHSEATTPTSPAATTQQMFAQRTPQKITQPQQQPLNQPIPQHVTQQSKHVTQQPQQPQIQQQQQQPQIQQQQHQWNPPQQQQQQQQQQPTPNANFQQPKIAFSNQAPTNQFSTSFSPSTKVERPHSSAALLQERPNPQTPTPFKQQASNTSQKMTLLAQAMSAGPPQQHSNFGQQQMTHQRNQSYSRAMSVPMLSQSDSQENVPSFQVHFESSLELNTKGIPAGSPILESPVNTGSHDSQLSSPPLTPSGTKNAQELWNNVPTLTDQPPVSQDTDWANFAAPQADNVSRSSSMDIPQKRLTQETDSMASSVPESISSVESLDAEDSVWRINEEQREYYTNQFQKLQPNLEDFIKGPQARDFFIKSTLPTEVLSKIWNLSDIDKDGALSLQEFCVAMHLVVAVRHGVDLPQVLPASLLVDADADLSSLPNGDGDLEDEDVSQLIQEDKEEESTEWSAEFDGADGQASSKIPVAASIDSVQTMAQPSPMSAATTEARIHPVSQEDTTEKTHKRSMENIYTEDTPSSPTQHAIARPRAAANKNVNLMDASPWQLLPPPSSKTNKQAVNAKKMLKMDSVEIGSDPSLSSRTSSEGRVDSLVNIDEINDKTSATTISTPEFDRLRITKPKDTYFGRNLSKEKSRSIDSLRSDISESSMFEWRRQSIRRESHNRSFNGENDTPTKEMEVPPIPPPRNKGHTRASSLDFNQMFGSKLPWMDDDDLRHEDSDNKDLRLQPPQKPPRANPPGTTPETNKPTSLEVSGNQEIRTDFKPDAKRFGSPISEGKRAGSKEHVVRFIEEPEVLASTKSPMEIQMRKHELQARLRDLKSKNTTLLSLISQLDMEWKEVSEERIALDVRLQRAEQELE